MICHPRGDQRLIERGAAILRDEQIEHSGCRGAVGLEPGPAKLFVGHDLGAPVAARLVPDPVLLGRHMLVKPLDLGDVHVEKLLRRFLRHTGRASKFGELAKFIAWL